MIICVFIYEYIICVHNMQLDQGICGKGFQETGLPCPGEQARMARPRVCACVCVCGYAFVCICVYTRTYMYHTLFVSRSLSVALALAHYLSRTRARSLSLSLGLSLCLPVVSLSLSLSLSVCLSLSVSLAFSHQNPTLSQRLRTPSAGFRIRTTSLNSPLQALSTVRERMNIFII